MYAMPDSAAGLGLAAKTPHVRTADDALCDFKLEPWSESFTGCHRNQKHQDAQKAKPQC